MNSSITEQKRDEYKNCFIRSGAVYIIFGILAIVFEVVKLMYYQDSYNEPRDQLTYCGVGIWCGSFFIVAGSLTVWAGNGLSSCKVVLAVTLSLFTMFFAVTLLSIEVITANILNGTSKTLNTSVISLHAMLGVVASLTILTAFWVLLSFFKTSFTRPSSAVPHRNLRSSSNFLSQTEMTRDDVEAPKQVDNGPVKVCYHRPCDQPVPLTTSSATASSVGNHQ